MVTIIKNQLLKHLSRFTKNLSPEQISVSALRGQGTLSSLQLDEAVLTELLELPAWMRLSSATCGRATFRVHWTKLKTMPIELNLEDIQILVETCAEPRGGADASPSSSTPSGLPPQRYSFIHKVIDGISITVNTARIQFTSPVFVATVQMSRITVESRTPQWQKGDLRLTRLKCTQTSQLLIFKEVSWQSARIEAKAVKEGGGLPPLRLLTNQAHCRITIKKRLSDCFVVGSRLVLILEEALWVLTDRQLGAALAFADSLSTLVRKASAQVTRDKAQRKLETLPEYLAQIYQTGRSGGAAVVTKAAKSTDPLAKLFAAHDVTETSYHFLSQKIDLHLCDDPGPGRSSHPQLTAGAALQVSLQKLQFDYYPYHLASANRNHWPGYRESAAPHTQWLSQALSTFRGNLLSLLEPQKLPSSDDHADLPMDPQRQATPPSSPHNVSTQPQSSSSPARKMVLQQLAKLMTTCVILRLEDYTLYKVSTGGMKEVPKAFICSDRDRFSLPDEVRALHVEFTHFYYPGDIHFPVPPPKLFVQLNPTRVLFDLASCLWCNSFVLNLLSCLQATQAASEAGDSDLAYVDINVEAIMPRVIVDAGKDFPSQKDRPRSLQAQVSRATVTNSRGPAGGSGELAGCLAALNSSALLSSPCCTDTMLRHATDDDKSSLPTGKEALRTRALWGQPRSVWCVRLEPVWADFCGARASPHKPTPLLDAVPFTLWVYMNMDEQSSMKSLKSVNSSINSYSENSNSRRFADRNSQEKSSPHSRLEDELRLDTEADLQVIGHCSQLVSLQLNHYQYLLVLRLAERLTELAAFLTLDAARVAGPRAKPKNMVVGCIIPQVEITLVLPSCCPGKESSRDLDSVLPDSSSLLDLHQNNTGSGTLCFQPNGSSIILSQSSLERHSTLTVSLPSIAAPKGNSLHPNHQPSGPASDRETSGGHTRPPSEADWKNEKTMVEPPNSLPKETMPNIANINASITSMRRGLTSLMSTLEAAVKPSDQSQPQQQITSGQSPGSNAATPSATDQWDAVSVASSDSERYVMVQLAQTEIQDASFKLWDGTANMGDGAVEVATEVVEQSSSPSERSIASSCRRRDLVSMSTFKLHHVEVLQISQGFYSRVSVNVGDVAAEDCPSIPWDELQSKFASRSRGWAESVASSRDESHNEEFNPKLRLRLDHFPNRTVVIPYESEDSVTLDSVMGSFSGLMDVVVRDLDLTLNMSTALGLSDLVEDEILVPPIPLEALLEGVSIKLNEDRPASSISSPGTVPVRLSLSGLRLSRGEDGVVHVRPAHHNLVQSSQPSITDMGIDPSTMKKLSQENEDLRRRLNALERLAQENDSLRRNKEETDILKACLLSAQDEVSALLDEKTTLLETVRSLQERASGVEVRGTSVMWGRAGNR